MCRGFGTAVLRRAVSAHGPALARGTHGVGYSPQPQKGGPNPQLPQGFWARGWAWVREGRTRRGGEIVRAVRGEPAQRGRNGVFEWRTWHQHAIVAPHYSVPHSASACLSAPQRLKNVVGVIMLAAWRPFVLHDAPPCLSAPQRLKNAARAPCPSLPVCDPKMPPGAYPAPTRHWLFRGVERRKGAFVCAW
jgi:hypothetical protein